MRARPLFLSQVPDELRGVSFPTPQGINLATTGETKMYWDPRRLPLWGHHLPRKFDQKLKTPFRREDFLETELKGREGGRRQKKTSSTSSG